jgi:hypothetical protein
MTEPSATIRKKAVAATPEAPKDNWHSISGIKVCPDCGEPRTSGNDGKLFCPVGKGDCAFVRTA